MKSGKITFLYLLFGFLSVFAVGLLLYFSLSTVMINEAVTSTEMSVSQSGKYLEVYIERIKTMAHLLSHNSEVIDYFSHESELTDKQNENRILKLIDEMLVADQSLQSIILISKGGEVFSNEEKLDMSMSKDMMKEEWYINAIDSDLPKLTSARMQSFSMDKDLWVISLSEEIVDKDGNNIGVVVIDIPYTAFETYLMDLHLGEDGYAFILNEQYEVVFHQDVRYYTDPVLIKNLYELKGMVSGYESGSERLISQYKMNNTDWTIIGVSSIDAISIIKRQIIESIILGCVFIFIGVIVTTVILKKLTQELSEKEEDIHNYEMNALYSQINPHFLYNTLDTIVWMAEFNQSEDVIKITKSLAQFFRLSLNQGKKLTTLNDEIEHVRQYLYIQKQRYQEKLSYTIACDEDLLEVLVPKIILQPIVENSIYHGIQELDGIGELNIRIKKDEKIMSDFTIEITDNGVGFDYTDKLESLPKSKKTKLGGVGLKNVHRRIELFCGLDYGVRVESRLGLGTTVIIRLRK